MLTGRRRSEVIGLTAGDISVEGDAASYSYRGKGGKRGRRELPPPAYEALQVTLADAGLSLTEMDQRASLWQAGAGGRGITIAREPIETRRLTPPEIVDYTRSLPRLWANSGPDGKQALVGAIFARLDVLGFQTLEYELTPDAMDLGLDAGLPARLELGDQIGECGRGERI